MTAAEERLPDLKLVHDTLPQYAVAVRAANPALQRFGVDFHRVALRPPSTAAATLPSGNENTYLDRWGMRWQRL